MPRNIHPNIPPLGEGGGAMMAYNYPEDPNASEEGLA